jgi:hypothetical protein
MRQTPNIGQVWAADTGRYGSPHEYTDESYLAWLEKMDQFKADNLFATAPDVVGKAKETLEMSKPMYSKIRALGYKVALVGQDDMERYDIPWDEFDAFFIGGTTWWKLSPEARDLASIALEKGKYLHMGRVNSIKRFVYAHSIGCHSVDGTVLKFDPYRRVEKWHLYLPQKEESLT